MRYYFLILCFSIAASSLRGQEKTVQENGIVSYISSQNIYVKFKSTEHIEVGDTLFLNKGGQMKPALVVNNKSSVSCVCIPITAEVIKISDELIFRKQIPESAGTGQPGVQRQDSISAMPGQTGVAADVLVAGTEPISREGDDDKAAKEELDHRQKKRPYEQKISGRISATSYNTIADSRNLNRLRYTFLMRGDHLGNSGLSFESYITFHHTLDEWDEVKNNVSSALKVYALSLKYDFKESTSLLLGRNINPGISSMGAMDGLQFEKGFGNFIMGAFVGFRPDHFDYSFNFDLFQYGVYAGHVSNTRNSSLQTTIAFIEQRNDFNIDRRFLYFQHSNSLAKNLHFFGSAELSLYQNINEEPKTVLDLTNLYLILRYRISRKVNVSLSYDNRKNIYYYETYKNFIDKLIEEETRQGVRLHASYRIARSIIWGVNTGWRFQKSDLNLSRNLNSYLTFSHIPGVNIRTTLTANFLRTNYLDSKYFGIRVSREFVPGKLNGDLNYRWVDYDYLNYETRSRQNIVGADLSWNIIKRLSLYLNYEIALDDHNIKYHQIFSKIIQRF